MRLVHVTLILASITLTSFADFTSAASKADRDTRCAELLASDFSSVPEAPLKIVGAKSTGTANGVPPACEVSGYVAPSVGFLIKLPRVQWNGKLLQLGCGGFCGGTDAGTTIPFDCDDPLRRGYACIVSDNGHRSTAMDALWAYGNPQAEIDHAYRGVHVTALAGKAVVARYYGNAPNRSYFMGSSTGGRLGLIAAQRFPWDFDGIVAGVPSLSVTGTHMNLLWGNRVMTDAAGESMLEQQDLETLHAQVIASCDLNDGLKDGLIGDPRACNFNPQELACSGAKREGCLTAQQVEAVLRIYQGPVTSRGEHVYMPGALKGSERTWLAWFRTLNSANTRATYDFVREEFRWEAFQPDAGLAWKPEHFDFDRDYKRLGVAQALSDAVNPDLRKFKAAGGKLVMFAGWSDAGGMPLHTVDYYETAERVLGGREATQEFFRLFVLPGMGHAFGDGAFAVDWLSCLEAWVEHERAPGEVLSFHIKIDDLDLNKPEHFGEVFRRMTLPWNADAIEFARPVYPYPIVARYRGHGDPRRASSFGPVEPDPAALSQFTRSGRL